ncbi:MAG: phosphoribosyltransferase-like protein [Luteibacter jiangsuensis]
MAGNAKFISSEPAKAWLSQFEAKDQPLATEMLRKMRLVSRDAFAEELQRMMTKLIEDGEPVALYVEREVPREEAFGSQRGEVLPLFSQPEVSPRRATGKYPATSVRPDSLETGSEGVVGQLVTEVCRRNPNLAFNHPGPDTIRSHKIRRIVFVTDCIGSGKRICENLTAAWKVASVRSWWSNRRKFGISFSVIAYAATERGRKLVEEHPALPSIELAVRCPTLEDSFSRSRFHLAMELCERYAPASRSSKSDHRGAARRALGFGGTGALIAFAHGAPNNVPTMFWRESGTWIPLFKGRVTAGTRESFVSQLDVGGVQDRLQSMRQDRLSRSMLFFQLNGPAGALILTLAASGRNPGNAAAIAEVTGLTISEVSTSTDKAVSHGWLDGRGRLTDAGRRQLDSFRSKRIPAEESVQKSPETAYYPSALREPVSSV